MQLDVPASVAAWLALSEADLRIARLVVAEVDASPAMLGLA